MSTILQKRIEEAAEKYSKKFETWNIEDDTSIPRGEGFKDGAIFALQNQWISVEEDLPPIRIVYENEKWSNWVLIKTSKGGTYLDSYIFHKHTWTNNRDDVTHWMPIPELPKGGE